MAKNERIALKTDPNDPEDGDVTEAALAQALADREERRRRGGRPKGSTTSNKSMVTLRLDNDVLERFRATGPGWQSRMNDALRRAEM